ncbi:hypothetical protein ACFL2T_04185 [Elusimicrobiota bacterium]
MRGGVLKAYYLATPVFVLLDVLFDLNFRIPFLDGVPMLKYVYYIVAFSCGILIVRVPKYSSLVTSIESLANIAMLVIGFMSKIISSVDALTVVGGQNPVPPQAVVSFAMSATALGIAYYGSEFKARRRSGDPDRDAVMKEFERRLKDG